MAEQELVSTCRTCMEAVEFQALESQMSVYLALEGQAATQEVQLLRSCYPVCAKGSPGPVGTSADQARQRCCRLWR
jgi:hypothetical protein